MIATESVVKFKSLSSRYRFIHKKMNDKLVQGFHATPLIFIDINLCLCHFPKLLITKRQSFQLHYSLCRDFLPFFHSFIYDNPISQLLTDLDLAPFKFIRRNLYKYIMSPLDRNQ